MHASFFSLFYVYPAWIMEIPKTKSWFLLICITFTYNSAYPGRRTAFGDKTDVLRPIHPNDSHSIRPDPTDRGEVIVSEKSTAVYLVLH